MMPLAAYSNLARYRSCFIVRKFSSTSSNGEPPSDEKTGMSHNDTTNRESEQEPVVQVEDEETETVDAWNKDAVAGPEWNGPRGYEPTRYGDWSNKGRVSDF